MGAESDRNNHTPQEAEVVLGAVASVEKSETWADGLVAEPESWSFPGKTIHILGTWEAESGDVPVAQEPGSSTYQGKKIDVDRNHQDPEITEANWTPEEDQCASSRDMREADDPLQETVIGVYRNPEATEVYSTTVGVRYVFARDRGTVLYAPILDAARFPVQTSDVQDTTGWEVGDLPTHPSSGHTHNTSPAQLSQGTCSAEAGKAAYNHSMANRPVC